MATRSALQSLSRVVIIWKAIITQRYGELFKVRATTLAIRNVFNVGPIFDHNGIFKDSVVNYGKKTEAGNGGRAGVFFKKTGGWRQLTPTFTTDNFLARILPETWVGALVTGNAIK